MAPNEDKKEHLLNNEEPENNVNSTIQTVAGVMGNVLEW